ncbi:hypothetical protein JZ751_027413 [Albula glossodonta]|uniref:Dynein regulatory complex subunit 2 n=1 Tax=Albula glossodonta TaxID=121402 RepID=A0A8T2NF35_9TELE|nr:hypothetical protein JZ751_027413 [Albula glossodonta]
MPKKGGKKNGGGKKAGMTEEERLVYVQQRALAEEAMAKEKRELSTRSIKDKLWKEEQRSIMNEFKLMEKWRAVLRHTLAQELRHDIDVLRQTFARIMDQKDSAIKNLVQHLAESKEQADLALHSHHQKIKELEEQHSQRLASLKQKCNAELDELRADFKTEREQIIAQHQEDCMEQQSRQLTLEENNSAVELETREEFMFNHGNIIDATSERKNKLSVQLGAQVEEMWRQIQEAKSLYYEASKDGQARYKMLEARNERDSTEIKTLAMKIQKMEESCKSLQAKISANKKQGEAAIQDLLHLKQEVSTKGQGLKKQHEKTCALNKANILSLTMKSSAATKKLQNMLLPKKAHTSRVLGNADHSQMEPGPEIQGEPGHRGLGKVYSSLNKPMGV